MTNADAKTMSIVAEIFAALPGRFRFASEPQAITRFLRWMANDIEELGSAGKLNRSIDYAFDPESDYVTTTIKENIQVAAA